MSNQILLVGDCILDVHPACGGWRVRLGGVFHSARAFSALGVPFSLAVFVPRWLEDEARSTVERLGGKIHELGEVVGAPNLLLVGESTEFGDQSYDLLLRGEYGVTARREIGEVLAEDVFADVLVYPGRYDLRGCLDALRAVAPARVHIDIGYDVDDLELLSALGCPFRTVFISTSSPLFRHDWSKNVAAGAERIVPALGERFVFKESRGGSRAYVGPHSDTHLEAPAHLAKTVHSVGVGDCFNASFLAFERRHTTERALALASHVAAAYAETWDDEQFAGRAGDLSSIPAQDLLTVRGTRVPWEERPRFPIYIAAPDFPGINRAPLENLVRAFEYHNFAPHRPILEHGLASECGDEEERRKLFAQDMGLLDSCPVLVAILLYDDPGTLIEIGIAGAQGKPVIVFDPYGIARNLVLEHVPQLISREPSEVVSAVFDAVSTLLASERI